ncbi:hypothetical protein GF376_00255 [Candidatus Peregrinibacteria bacterium]|nr:hypothetical protein [Candidatus Peregrinibacteria bacterium]
MNRTYFVISDIELGKKDLFDDFKDLAALLKFIQIAKETAGPISLIFNGDTFDYLKMPYQSDHPIYITEKISTWKTDQIIRSYPEFFDTLKEFCQKKEHQIHFIIGNHDQDLYWPIVQNQIIKRIESSKNQIRFQTNISTPEFHIEHGNQVDYFYQINPNQVFIKSKNGKILNTSFGHFLISKYFINLKKNYPDLEKIYPRDFVFKQYPEYKKTKNKLKNKLLLKALLLNNPFDKITSFKYSKILKHIAKYGFEMIDDEHFTEKRFETLSGLYPSKQLYIMGHSHLNYDYSHHYTRNIITNTWREEYTLEQNGKIMPKEKSYAIIKTVNDLIHNVEFKIIKK